MTWDAFHRRGDVLRAVVAEANRRRDGVLPMDLPGVAETFGDELDLVAALQLRWHTRLAGRIERALAGRSPSTSRPRCVDRLARRRGRAGRRPRDPRRAARRARPPPSSATALRSADRKDRRAAGRDGRPRQRRRPRRRRGSAARLEEKARAAYDPTARRAAPAPPRTTGPPSLLGRLKAHLAA